MTNITTTEKPIRPTLTWPALAGRLDFADPWRMMQQLLADPFGETGLVPAAAPIEGFVPRFDLKEIEQGYVIKADLPGVLEKDVEISMHGNRMQITGTRKAEKEEKTETYFTSERTYGGFTRIFTLPEDADVERVKAELKDGVLTVNLGKVATAKVRKVPIAG